MYVFRKVNPGYGVNLKVMVLFGVFLVSLNLAAWQKDGVPIATGPGDDEDPKLAVLGNDFIVAYKTFVPGANQVKVVRVNGQTGAIIWEAPVRNDSGQDQQQIAVDQNGKIWVVFEKYQPAPWAISLQRFTPDGVREFGPLGLEVSSAAGYRDTPQFCLDGSGEGCYVTWTDWRSGNADVWAARVTKDGNVAWSKRIGPGGPVGIISSGNDAIIEGGPLWKIDTTGNILWDTVGVSVADTIASIQSVVSDRRNGVIVFFQGAQLSLRVQRIDTSGQRMWGKNGMVLQTWPLSNHILTSQASDFGFTEDGYGGCLVSTDRGQPLQHWVFRVDSSGNNVWPSGIKIWAAADWYQQYSLYSTLTYDSSGGCIAAWDTHSDSTIGDIMVQRVDKNGWTRFQNNGLTLCGNPADQTMPVIAYLHGGAVVLWNDLRRDCPIRC